MLKIFITCPFITKSLSASHLKSSGNIQEKEKQKYKQNFVGRSRAHKARISHHFGLQYLIKSLLQTDVSS